MPVTGVFQNNHCEYLAEEMDNAINATYEEHCTECPNEVHDMCFEWSQDDTFLIGFRKNEKGEYEPDPEAKYSAIVGEVYTQVVRSKWGIRCAWCSPCYPNQGDADTPGDVLSYALPPEVVGDTDPEVKARIFELEKEGSEEHG